MVSWYIASHGKVTGPLSLEETRSAIESNNRKDPQFFVWQPNFVYWQPAYSVSEFSDIAHEVKHATPVFDDLKERERILTDRIEYIDAKLKQTHDNMMAFEDDIIAYQKLTANFSPEVQKAIVAIEKKFHLLSKKVNGVDSATEIAKTEIANVRKAFDSAEPIELEQIEADEEQSSEVAADAAANEGEHAEQAAPVAQPATSASAQSSASSQREAAESKDDANSKGIRGMFKSVFKEPEPEQRLSEVLKQTEAPKDEKEEDIELVVIDDEESLETVKKRRRRRRR